jgi:hypothetical protein
MVLEEDLLQRYDEGRVDGASCRMWAAEKVIFVFAKVAACRCAGRRRSQLHAVLTGLEWEYVIHPLDQEEAVGTTTMNISEQSLANTYRFMKNMTIPCKYVHTTGAIATKPTCNAQGGFWFYRYSLTTGRMLDCRCYTSSLPMPQDVIELPSLPGPTPSESTLATNMRNEAVYDLDGDSDDDSDYDPDDDDGDDCWLYI